MNEINYSQEEVTYLIECLEATEAAPIETQKDIILTILKFRSNNETKLLEYAKALRFKYYDNILYNKTDEHSYAMYTFYKEMYYTSLHLAKILLYNDIEKYEVFHRIASQL